MLRVDFAELEPSDDYLLMLYKETPFNGVAFEQDENGTLVAEANFIEGQKNGISKEWSPLGVMISEQSFALNALHGASREWFDNGAPKIDGVYELSVCIKEQEWDVDGNEVRRYVIDENGPEFATLRKLRASNLGRMLGLPL